MLLGSRDYQYTSPENVIHGIPDTTSECTENIQYDRLYHGRMKYFKATPSTYMTYSSPTRVNFEILKARTAIDRNQ